MRILMEGNPDNNSDGSNRGRSHCRDQLLPSQNERPSFTATQMQAAGNLDSTKVAQSTVDVASPVKDRKQRKRHKPNSWSRPYRDLFDVAASGALRVGNNDAARLHSSQIGASYWTTREKEALFAQLSSCGQGELQSLSNAVRTKSKSEIEVYLRLLKLNGSSETVKDTSKDLLFHSDLPAAVDITYGIELDLDNHADLLAKSVDRDETQDEKRKYGDAWLVDSAAADQLERNFDELAENEERESHEQGSGTEERRVRTTGYADEALRLLRPAALLQLSRNLFMNSSDKTELNWHVLQKQTFSISQVSDEPALYRSALEAFYNLTVSFTRRLLYASIFQATSRLRANDRTHWNPVSTIRDIDVRTAADIIGVHANYREYWASVPRRCKVDVYSDSKKFADGRPLTHSGYLLTSEEAEAKLGLRHPSPSSLNNAQTVADIDDGEVMDFIEDSDLWTEEDEATEDEKEQSDCISRPVPQLIKTFGPKRKRKRDSSPSTLARNECRYLDALDHKARLDEETELVRSLELDPSSLPEGTVAIPNLRDGKLCLQDRASDWRDQVEYEAVWERQTEGPGPTSFNTMKLNGQAGHKRRTAMYDRGRELLASGLWDVSDSEQGGCFKEEEDNEDDDANENENDIDISARLSMDDDS